MNERRFVQLFFNKEQLSLSDMGALSDMCAGGGSRDLREMKPQKCILGTKVVHPARVNLHRTGSATSRSSSLTPATLSW